MKKFNNLKKRLKKVTKKHKADLSGKVVTNANLAEHKQDIFKRARGLLVPLHLTRKKVLIITGVILGVFAVVWVSVFAVLIYRYKSDSSLVYRTAQIIPYPAAKVGSMFIMYDDYIFELRYQKKVYQGSINQEENASPAIDFTSVEGKKILAELEKAAMQRAKENAVTKQLAREQGIKLSNEDLRQAEDELILRQGGEDKFNTAIQEFFGWDMKDFRKALKLQMLQQRLDARGLAENVLQQVRNGGDFAELARKYSQDPGSKDQGGDLGYVTTETPFVEEFKKAAFALQQGQVSDLVETEFGHHIITVTEKKSDTEIKVSHILVNYNSLIEQRLRELEAKDYVDVGKV